MRFAFFSQKKFSGLQSLNNSLNISDDYQSHYVSVFFFLILFEMQFITLDSHTST